MLTPNNGGACFIEVHVKMLVKTLGRPGKMSDTDSIPIKLCTAVFLDITWNVVFVVIAYLMGHYR